MATLIPESKNHAKVYNNPCYILKSNTRTPLSSHRTPRKGCEVRKNLDPTRFKLQGIPPYAHKKENSPQNNVQCQLQQQIVLYNTGVQQQTKPVGFIQQPWLHTQLVLNVHQNRLPIR